MATDTRTMIERAASIYALEQPSETEFEAYVSRIETGSLTLSSAIEEIALVSNREEASNPLARMFFLLFDRAPDPVLFAAGMSALRGGATLEQIAETGLLYTGLGPNSLQSMSDSQFIGHLSSKMWNSPPNGFNPNVFVDLLTTMTRAEMLAAACRYTDATVTYVNKIDPALIYLVAANRQATGEELDQASAMTSLNLIRDVLVEADEDPYGGKPYWLIAGNTLLVEGSYSEDFILDLANNTAQLGESSDFQLILTRDGGATESTITFRPSIISAPTRIDARLMDAESSGSVTLKGGTTIYAGNIDSIVIGTEGNDSIFGGDGNDTIFGLAGIDSMTGGAGDDIFKLDEPNTYDGVTSLVTISDFGNGEDTLDVSAIFGSTESTALTIISGNSNPTDEEFIDLSSLLRNQVAVIENVGIWPTTIAGQPSSSAGSLTPRTTTNIFELFFNVEFEETITLGSRNLLITTDQINGGDIWLIENLTELQSIEASEITKIGHIDSTYPDLFSDLTAAGSIIG